MGSLMENGGNKPNRQRNKVRSQETTVTILKGSPMFYSPDGTGDGIDVVQAGGLAAVLQGFFAGFAMQDIAPGKIREGLVHGVCEYARVIVATRAASTDVWASYAAGAIGDVMSVNTATNDGASGIQALSRVGVGSAGIFPMWALGTSYASATTQASSIGSAAASLYSTSAMKVFVRSL